jgi:hypothetical protein
MKVCITAIPGGFVNIAYLYVSWIPQTYFHSIHYYFLPCSVVVVVYDVLLTS